MATTVQDFLDIVYDEQWVKLCFEDEPNKNIDIWGADWIGGYEETLEEVEPYLDYEVDEMFVAKCKNPESSPKYVQMICVSLYPPPKKKGK